LTFLSIAWTYRLQSIELASIKWCINHGLIHK